MKEARQFIHSLHAPHHVEISGFEKADDSVHMLEWLRRGPDFRTFVVQDAEAELYAQEPRSQLVSAEITGEPDFQTKMLVNSNGQQGIVTEFKAIFPVLLRVRTADNAIWRLKVNHQYTAANLDTPPEFQLKFDFSIIDHQLEA